MVSSCLALATAHSKRGRGRQVNMYGASAFGMPLGMHVVEAVSTGISRKKDSQDGGERTTVCKRTGTGAAAADRCSCRCCPTLHQVAWLACGTSCGAAMPIQPGPLMRRFSIRAWGYCRGM